jgi:hypothetical protein
LAGKVLARAGHHRAHIEVRNKIRKSDVVEVIKPTGPAMATHIHQIVDTRETVVDVAQPGQRVTIDIETDCDRLDLLRLSVKRHGT